MVFSLSDDIDLGGVGGDVVPVKNCLIILKGIEGSYIGDEVIEGNGSSDERLTISEAIAFNRHISVVRSLCKDSRTSHIEFRVTYIFEFVVVDNGIGS